MTSIAIIASGSRGDVQPYVALGRGLRDAGHQVRVHSSSDFAGLAEEAGLEFRSNGLSLEALLQTEEWRSKAESGNFLVLLRQMTAETKRRAHELARDLPAELAGADLILTGLAGLGGTFSIAEALDIPIIQAYLYPLTPTHEYPGPLTPPFPLPKAFNGLSFRATRQMIWQTTRAGDAVTRQDLGLPKASVFGPFGRLAQRPEPILYGYSRHVVPRPDDWDSRIHVTGYWFLDEPDGWQPPAELAEFLAAGPPPVYIGFGSLGNSNPEEVTRQALAALELSGQRGVLASGWGGLSEARLPETVFMLRAAPHSWLFPRMTAVVHHGGAGTTAAGLRAGVPSVIVPFFGDQPFWGRRVAELGAGPQPIPRRQLTAGRLATAIGQAVSDDVMRRRAAELGAAIRGEDGVGQAVQHIEAWLSKSPRPAVAAPARREQ